MFWAEFPLILTLPAPTLPLFWYVSQCRLCCSFKSKMRCFTSHLKNNYAVLFYKKLCSWGTLYPLYNKHVVLRLVNKMSQSKPWMPSSNLGVVPKMTMEAAGGWTNSTLMCIYVMMWGSNRVKTVDVKTISQLWGSIMWWGNGVWSVWPPFNGTKHQQTDLIPREDWYDDAHQINIYLKNTSHKQSYCILLF